MKTFANNIRYGQTSLLVALAFAGLTACSSGDDLGPKVASDFSIVAGSDVLTTLDPGVNQSTSNSVSEPGVGLVAYAAGLESLAPRAAAYAGIESGSTVGATQTSGTGTYTGFYGVAIADDVDRGSTFITAQTGQSAGNVTLNANFGDGTLTGTGSSIAGGFTTDITVDGAISGSDVSGTVLVNHQPATPTPGLSAGSVTATLDGLIGADGALGAFHGTDSNTALAGGFAASAP